MAMTKKEKQVIADMIFRITHLGGHTGNPYRHKEVKEAIKMVGNTQDCYSDNYMKYVSKELKEENEKLNR